MLTLALWCVFAGDIRDLGHDRFEVREAAHRRLERWSWLAWPLLDHRWPDAEVDRRARVLCGPQLAPPCRPSLVAFPLPGQAWKELLGLSNPVQHLTELGPGDWIVETVWTPSWLYLLTPSAHRREWDNEWGGIVKAEVTVEQAESCYRWARRSGVPRCALDPIWWWGMKRQQAWR